MAEGRASDGSLSARFGGSLGVLSNNLSGLLDGSGCACRRHAARLYALSKSPNNNLCAVSSECPTAFQPQAASVPQTDQVRSPKSSKKRRSKGEKEKDKRSTWRWSILDQQVSPEKQPAGQASFSGLPYAKQWMARQSIDRFISTVNDEVDSAASPETSTGVYAARAKSKTFRMPHAARAEKSASVPSAAALRESESQESKASDAEERLLEARAVLNLPGAWGS